MKLRLRANTIRLRLIKSEVETLSTGHTVTDTIATPTPFHYKVHPTNVEELSATFDANTLTIQVPIQWAINWPHTDQVGRQATTNGLDILIEKDWACTTPRLNDDDSGTYPNPTALS